MIPKPTNAVVTRRAASGRAMASPQNPSSAARTIQLLDGARATERSTIPSAAMTATRPAAAARRRTRSRVTFTVAGYPDRCSRRPSASPDYGIVEVREETAVELFDVGVERFSDVR